jgi:hypothetical protein
MFCAISGKNKTELAECGHVTGGDMTLLGHWLFTAKL